MAPLEDNFGAQAKSYARYRPGYPEELYDWLFSHTAGRELAWDCGTGNGQVAVRLAKDFASVLATDLSQGQLDHALPASNVTYRCSFADNSGLEESSVDLLTVATALHWFDLEPFFTEARRVLRPGGLIAVWTYGPGLAGPAEITDITSHLIDETLAEDWPEGIHWVREEYRTLSFPFQELEAPSWRLSMPVTVESCLGWLGTMSALARYRERTGDDPLDEVANALRRVWPAAEGATVTLSMPLFLRAGHPE